MSLLIKLQPLKIGFSKSETQWALTPHASDWIMNVDTYEKIYTDRTVVNMNYADNKNIYVGSYKAEWFGAEFQ